MFEWNEAKNNANIAKHGISFEEAALIFSGKVLSAVDTRFDYSETRFQSIGKIEDVICVVVIHTDRKNNIRIISARLANKSERQRYENYIKTTP